MVNTALQATLIQGGMGVGVSRWRLARAVAAQGQLGVISGTAIDAVHARLLQDGDPGGHLRRAYAEFPVPEVAERVLARWYAAEGRPPETPYRPQPMLTAAPSPAHRELLVLSNFAEVWLAKEGHDGPVGVNHLEKVQMATVPSLYGAMLAGVDAVLMGAGIPSAIPRVLRDLVAGQPVDLRLDVDGAGPGQEFTSHFDPAWLGPVPSRLTRPVFLAIVSAVSLARFLARDDDTRPDGFVVELSTAGGHNAPPRGPRRLDDEGQPIYGPRDTVDPSAMAALGLPFWMAGSFGSPEQVRQARAAGAVGVQVGTVFALCEESEITPELRHAVLDRVVRGEAAVRTDPLASPSGFPFKVASVPDTISEESVYAERERVCDLGYLRTPYVRADGRLGYRCAAEPVDAYVRKGGDPAATQGRTCLCNGLIATVGLGQRRGHGVEPPVVTAGQAVVELGAQIGPDGRIHAADVVAHLVGESEPAGR